MILADNTFHPSRGHKQARAAGTMYLKLVDDQVPAQEEENDAVFGQPIIAALMDVAQTIPQERIVVGSSHAAGLCRRRDGRNGQCDSAGGFLGPWSRSQAWHH